MGQSDASTKHTTSPVDRATIDAIGEAIFVHDLDGQFVEVNARACAVLGYTRDQLLELSVFDVETEHSLSLTRDRWREVFDDGETVSVRSTHRCADGTRIPVEVRVTPLKAPGNPPFFIATARPAEIDDCKPWDLDAAVASELAAFRRLFESAQDAIAIVDQEGRYLIQNDAHRELLGYSDRDLTGCTPAIHLGPAVFAQIAAELNETGQHRGEHEARRKDGVAFRLDLTAFAVRPSDGSPPVFVGIKRDLSAVDEDHRARCEQLVAELANKLEHAQKMEVIGQLAAGVAHDFNNLLTPIVGFAELELSAGDSLPSATSFRQILMAAQRGRDLTRRLLAFGRKQLLEVRALDLLHEIDSFEKIVRRVLPSSIRVSIAVDKDVHPVRADATQLQQVFINLATNAGAAMPRGGSLNLDARNVIVESGHELARLLGRDGEFVCITFADSGEGIPAEHLEKIYEPFFTTHKSDGGTGLGLSIVYGIVQQHGGYVSATSEVGHGTTFRIYLPPTARPVTPQGTAPEPRLPAGETVLVAEDEPQVLELVERVLRSQGYVVLVADQGDEAARLAAEHPGSIDLLLTDVVMPGMSGPELYAEVSKTRPQLRVLYMSGYARDVLSEDGLATGLQILQKPFTASELSRRVRESMRT